MIIFGTLFVNEFRDEWGGWASLEWKNKKIVLSYQKEWNKSFEDNHIGKSSPQKTIPDGVCWFKIEGSTAVWIGVMHGNDLNNRVRRDEREWLKKLKVIRRLLQTACCNSLLRDSSLRIIITSMWRITWRHIIPVLH